jgi:hypothetical protein
VSLYRNEHLVPLVISHNVGSGDDCDGLELEINALRFELSKIKLVIAMHHCHEFKNLASGSVSLPFHCLFISSWKFKDHGID